jgi:antitoxin MazE
MRAWLRKWGNSAAVRLPAATLAAAGLRVDQEVEVRVEDGRVVIEPLADDGYLAAVEGALGEWTSPEDEAAWAAL